MCLISLKKRKLTDQWFTFVDKSSGETYHFDITGIYEWLAASPEEAEKMMFVTDLNKEHYEQLMQDSGVEEPRVKRLCEPYLSLPILFVEWPDGSHVLIDGNHRYARKYRDGKKIIQIFMIPEWLWRMYLIEGIEDIDPEMLKKMPSGL